MFGIKPMFLSSYYFDERIFSSDEKTPHGRRDGVLQVRRASNAGAEINVSKQAILARRFLMLRKANEVIGVRQYYEYGELRLSDV